MNNKIKQIMLSKRSLALITSFVTISNLTSPVLDMEEVKTATPLQLKNIDLTTVDASEYQRKVISDNYGQPTLTQVIGAILEDARGPCLGAIRCAIALTNNETYTLEDRFKSLGLDTNEVGEYAISISGNLGRARALAIIENKVDNHYYTKYILNNFIQSKATSMRLAGLQDEARIAENAIVKDIGKFTTLAMNPHAEQSMGVIEDGLNRLIY